MPQGALLLALDQASRAGRLGETVLRVLVLLGESREPLRLACLVLIVAGVIGLKLVTPTA